MFRTWLLVSTLLMAACSGNDKTGPTPSAGPLWSAGGLGNDVRTKPDFVQKVRITGSYSGFSSNFIIWCGPNLLVNELLGTGWGPTSYNGTHATPNCGQIEVRNSTGVSWTLTEVR